MFSKLFHSSSSSSSSSSPMPRHKITPTDTDSYNLYLLEDNKPETIASIQMTVKGGNAILLYPQGVDSSSSGSRKYHACFLQDGQLLTEAGKLKEVSIGERILTCTGLLPKTPMHTNIIQIALARAEISVPLPILHLPVPAIEQVALTLDEALSVFARASHQSRMFSKPQLQKTATELPLPVPAIEQVALTRDAKALSVFARASHQSHMFAKLQLHKAATEKMIKRYSPMMTEQYQAQLPESWNNEENNPKPSILYACDVIDDGIGDAQHLIDFVKNHKNNPCFSGYAPLIFLTFSTKNKEMIEKILQEEGWTLPSDNLHLVCHDYKKHDDYQTFHKYLKDNESRLLKQLQNTKGMINISTNAFALSESNQGTQGDLLKKFIDKHNIIFSCLSIGEHSARHHGRLSFTSPNLSLGIDKHEGYVGFKIEKLEKTNPYDALLHIEDKIFLATLLGQTVPEDVEPSEIKISAEDCRSFLTHSLFVPSYCQDMDAAGTFDQIMRGVASSSLARDYKEIVFQGSIRTPNDFKEYRTSLPDEIGRLTIIRKEGKKITSEVLINPKSPSGKAVRIIEGFRLNKSDYDRVLGLAQFFHLVSGDNSFEHALSHDVIPLYDVKYWKLDFIMGFKEYVTTLGKPHVQQLLNLLIKNHGETPKLDLVEDFATILGPQLVVEWKEVMVDLRKNYNVYNKMPKLGAELLARTEALHAAKVSASPPEREMSMAQA